MKQKAEFTESLEEQNIFHSDDILCPNMQQEEILEKGETTQQGDCTESGQNSRNLENVIILEMSPITTEALEEVVSYTHFACIYLNMLNTSYSCHCGCL
jgi:hypothetical protein